MGALAIATAILEAIPPLLQAGLDVTTLVESANAVIKAAQAENRDPTDAEWAGLDTQLSALRAQLSAA